jgi:hypothetical protein
VLLRSAKVNKSFASRYSMSDSAMGMGSLTDWAEFLMETVRI